MARALHDVNRVATLIAVDSATGLTPTPLEVDSSTGELLVKMSSDIEIGAVEIKDATTDNRVTVTASGTLRVDGSGATYDVTGTVTTGEDSVSNARYYTNHLDDFTTANITYVGQEDVDGVWRIIKIDETSNFPVFTYATITNNVTLTDYATAWAARTTATYNTYNAAF